ncbi:MAG: GTPase domain-containing protein [Candidatus Kariarchaeaceae archaeon]
MRDTYQIIVLGPGGVGKTKGTITLMNILQNLGFRTSEVKPWSEDMVTTSNYVIHNFTVPDDYFQEFDEPFYIVLFDLGGQFKYREHWLKFASETDAIISVVDITRKTTLQQMAIMLPQGIMKDVPVRLIVNKGDLYLDFLNNLDTIADHIHSTIQQTKALGMVNYSVLYRGEENFVFNSKVYKYGDRITIMRPLSTDESGNKSIKMGDLEAMVAQAFIVALPNLNEHNSYLFGREFTLQAFNIMYELIDSSSTLLSDDIVEQAHLEAPPFISWGSDPDSFMPLDILTPEIINQSVKSMLIEDQDLWAMVKRLRRQGYNIDVDDERSWSLTSAILQDENPDVPYKPMHKAILPPFFIKKMIDYSLTKSSDNEEEYFV